MTCENIDELIQELIPQREYAAQMGYGYYAEAFDKAITALQEQQEQIEELQAQVDELQCYTGVKVQHE